MTSRDTKKALLIGCNYTSTPYQLKGCVNDIVNMSHFLTDALDYDLKNLIMLRDDNPSMPPTKVNILGALKHLVSQSANLTEIWFHYSGHGSRVRDVNGDEADGLDEVIVPLDFTRSGLITDDNLFDIIKDVKCRLVMIFDSCNSGSICDLQYMFEFDGTNLVKSKDTNKAIANSQVYVLSGCKDVQLSADIYSLEQQQGVGAFTDSLLTTMRVNHCYADILKIYTDTCIYMKSRKFTQTPVFTASTETPVFLITRPGTVSTAPAAVSTWPVQTKTAKTVIKKTLGNIIQSTVATESAANTASKSLTESTGLHVLFPKNIQKMRIVF